MKQAQTIEQEKAGVLRGELVLRQITALKSDMKAALDQIDFLLIDLSEAKVINRSFLQHLCQGHRAMDELKTALLQAGEESPSILSEGYFRHVGCMLGCQDSCLWHSVK